MDIPFKKTVERKVNEWNWNKIRIRQKKKKKRKKKTGSNWCVYNFPVDYRAFDTSQIIDIHKYLTKKVDIK